MHVVQEWWHLEMLKQVGRGHDSCGVAGTHNGELAVECPACPIPGVNLPDGWEDADLAIQSVQLPIFFLPLTDKTHRFLYMLLLAMDANFHLKRTMVSSDQADLGLGTGWSFFVPKAPY